MLAFFVFFYNKYIFPDYEKNFATKSMIFPVHCLCCMWLAYLIAIQASSLTIPPLWHSLENLELSFQSPLQLGFQMWFKFVQLNHLGATVVATAPITTEAVGFWGRSLLESYITVCAMVWVSPSLWREINPWCKISKK